MANERAIIEIAAEVDDALKRLDQLERRMIGLKDDFNTALGKVKTDKLEGELDDLDRAMQDVGAEAIRTGQKARKGLGEMRKHSQLAAESVDDVEVQLKQVDRQIDRVRASMTRFGQTAKRSAATASKALRGLGGLVTGLRGAFLALGGAFVLKEITVATQRQAQAEALLNQIIETTGSAAGVTAEEIKKLASSLQDVTLFGDEATIEAANIAATFKNIGSRVFPEVIERALDLAQVLAQGQGGTPDVKAAMIQLGKAINDPVANLSALSRAGIQFTTQQKDQIKTLIETGRTYEAQRLILNELEAQFGGTARAAREAAGGGMKALQNRVGDIAEDIGDGLLPALDRLSTQLDTGLATDKASDRMEKFGKVIGTIVTGLAALGKGLGVFPALVQGFGAAITKVFEGILRGADLLYAALGRLPSIGQQFRDARVDIQREADILAEAAEDLGRRAEAGLRDARSGLVEDWEFVKRTWTESGEAAEEAAGKVGALGDATEDAGEKAGGAAAGVTKFLEAVAGSAVDLEAETEAILAGIAALKEKGEISQQVAANIGTEVASVLEDFERFGIEAPAALQALAQEFPIVQDGLIGIGEAARSGATGIAEMTAEAQRLSDTLQEQQSGVDGLTGSVEGLESQIAELEGKPILSPAEVNQLFEAQDALNQARGDLAEGQRDLTDTQAQLQNAQDASIGSTEDTAAATDLLTDSFGNEFDAVASVADAIGQQLVPESERAEVVMTELADGSKKLSQATEDAADGAADLGDSLEKAGEGATKAAEGIQDLSEAGDEEGLAQTGESVDKLGDSLEALKEQAAQASGAVTSAAGSMEGALNRAVAACERLRDCLNSIGT